MIAAAVVLSEALIVGSGCPARAVPPSVQARSLRMQVLGPDEPDQNTFSDGHRQQQRTIMAAARLQILQNQLAEGDDSTEPFDVKMRCESANPMRIYPCTPKCVCRLNRVA